MHDVAAVTLIFEVPTHIVRFLSFFVSDTHAIVRNVCSHFGKKIVCLFVNPVLWNVQGNGFASIALLELSPRLSGPSFRRCLDYSMARTTTQKFAFLRSENTGIINKLSCFYFWIFGVALNTTPCVFACCSRFVSALFFARARPQHIRADHFVGDPADGPVVLFFPWITSGQRR